MRQQLFSQQALLAAAAAHLGVSRVTTPSGVYRMGPGPSHASGSPSWVTDGGYTCGEMTTLSK